LGFLIALIASRSSSSSAAFRLRLVSVVDVEVIELRFI
jgi:hypothetical protein